MTKKILIDLIKIPSYIGPQADDSVIAKWIDKFIKTNTKLKVVKQYFTPKRFNVVAYNSNKPRVLITGHIDTVQPQANWQTDPFKPVEKNGKIFGLGVSDMKSGIAIMLSLLLKQSNNQPIMYLFYGDEEYDFLGMKKFVEEYKNRIKPKLIISLDGEGLQISNSCRGLIEMKVSVEGKAGHAANPKSGVNAITESFKVIEKLKLFIGNFKSKELGSSTLNVAYINGGGSEGNIIAEKCEYIVEIRVANEKLNSKVAKDFITRKSEKLGLKVVNVKIRHDLKSWITPVNKLERILKIAPKKKLANIKNSGYIDIQILWDAFGKTPTFTFGPGEKGMAHKANEFVQIKNIVIAEQFLQKLLKML